MVRYFQAEGVRTVAMEATGVYWINLYAVLQEAGLEVVVVTGAHCRHFPGRKTDMKDCQWLAVLHAHGLWSSGFVPPADIRRLRDYMHIRADRVSLAAQHVQHMQKAMDRLNVKIHVVIKQIAEVLREMSAEKPTPDLGKRKELRHNAIGLPALQQQMGQIFGKDLTKLPCLNESTVALLLAEIGHDMSRWKDWRHFGSWLALAPCTAQSGKRRRREKRYLTRAGRILCQAVPCMAVGKHTWLASFYRRIRATRGAKTAIKATAYKLAKLIFLVLTQGWEYVETGMAKYEEKVRQMQLRALKKLARTLNYDLVPKAA